MNIFDAIANYFDLNKRTRTEEDEKNNIAFTIKEKLDSGNYKVVRGIFSKESEIILDDDLENIEFDGDISDDEDIEIE